MSTSGLINYSQNAYSLCKDALILSGAGSPQRTPPADIMDLARRILNRMMKTWQEQGMHLWTQNEGVIILNPGTASYTFANTSFAGESTGLTKANSLAQTTLSVAADLTDTVLTVDDSTGMAANDVVIIELDGDLHDRLVTTIVSVDSATQITVTAGLTDSAALGNYIYSYPAADSNFFPSQIYNVRVEDSSGLTNKMTALARGEFYSYPQRSNTGVPATYYVDDQRLYKTISLYPTPADMRSTVRFTYAKALEDVDALTDDVDFPPSWQEAIVLNLGEKLALYLGNSTKADELAPRAMKALADALYWDQEKVDVQFTPRTWE